MIFFEAVYNTKNFTMVNVYYTYIHRIDLMTIRRSVSIKRNCRLLLALYRPTREIK